MVKNKIKKFKAKPSKSDDVKKVKLENGEVEVFECFRNYRVSDSDQECKNKRAFLT